MKYILILSISFYKTFFSPILDSFLGKGSGCRFQETCSTYSARMIKEKGAVKGLALSFARIMRCQPFSKAYKNESV